MRARPFPAALALVAAVALPMSGCARGDASEQEASGYTARSLYPEQYHSVAVPIFENRTFVTGLERDITDALIKEIQARTPYRVLNSESAQTQLSGVITAVEKTRLNRARGSGLVREMLLSVTVDFQWRDLRTGKVIVDRREFSVGDEYMPSRPFGERPDVAEYGLASNLASEIVAAMRDQW